MMLRLQSSQTFNAYFILLLAKIFHFHYWILNWNFCMYLCKDEMFYVVFSAFPSTIKLVESFAILWTSCTQQYKVHTSRLVWCENFPRLIKFSLEAGKLIFLLSSLVFSSQLSLRWTLNRLFRVPSFEKNLKWAHILTKLSHFMADKTSSRCNLYLLKLHNEN